MSGLPIGVLSAVGIAWVSGATSQTILSLTPKSVTAGIAVSICAMRPQLEQRLSLVDFGHFRSRRKAIEGWRENGAGVSGAAGRLVELGE